MRIEKSDIFKQYEGRIAFRSIAALAGILIIFTVMLGTIGYSVITKALTARSKQLILLRP